MGNRPDASLPLTNPPAVGPTRGTTIGRPRGSYGPGRGGAYGGRGGGGAYGGRGGGAYGGRGGGAGRYNPVANIPCLVCEEMVSPETMVFHLAHKHFQVSARYVCDNYFLFLLWGGGSTRTSCASPPAKSTVQYRMVVSYIYAASTHELK